MDFSIFQSCVTIVTTTFRVLLTQRKKKPIPISYHMFPKPSISPSTKQPLVYSITVDLPIIDIPQELNRLIHSLLVRDSFHLA